MGPMSHPHSGNWNQLRQSWARLLPMPCCRCGQSVYADDDWQLDHLHPVALGGGPDTARPAHRDCNARAGVETREQIKAAGVAALLDDPFFPTPICLAALPGLLTSVRS